MLPTVTLPYLGTIPTYGVVLAVYFACAILLLHRIAGSLGVDRRRVLGAVSVGVPSGIIGSRLLDMLEYSDRYHSVADVLGRSGSSIYGGLILDFIVTVAYARVVGLPLLFLLDAGAPLVAFGEAASRVGCFFNGCCYGIEWNGPFAVHFPPNSFAFGDQVIRGIIAAGSATTIGVHPVQLYSAFTSTVAGIWLMRRLRLRGSDGTAFFSVLVFYGCLRLAMAPLRVEALPSMKVFSLVFIAVGTFGLAFVRRTRRPSPVCLPGMAS
jgi:phosphatidylglycerol:prolipoprotein diacylglycerol transferase